MEFKKGDLALVEIEPVAGGINVGDIFKVLKVHDECLGFALHRFIHESRVKKIDIESLSPFERVIYGV